MDTSLDDQIIQALVAARTPDGVAFFSTMTNLGGAAVVILVALAAFFVLRESKRWQYGLGMIVSLAGALAVAECVKLLVARPRPPLFMHAVYEVGYSFPSNHATAAMALYGFLAFAAWHATRRGWRILLVSLCALIILMVGFSRVYLGVHYPSDVLAGYAIGLLFAWIGARTTEKLLSFSR